MSDVELLAADAVIESEIVVRNPGQIEVAGAAAQGSAYPPASSC
jgi:hypothetical protein